jgi:hypothetical protein
VNQQGLFLIYKVSDSFFIFVRLSPIFQPVGSGAPGSNDNKSKRGRNVLYGCIMSFRKFQNIWIWQRWIKPQNKKTIIFSALFMPKVFTKIIETKNIPHS